MNFSNIRLQAVVTLDWTVPTDPSIDSVAFMKEQLWQAFSDETYHGEASSMVTNVEFLTPTIQAHEFDGTIDFIVPQLKRDGIYDEVNSLFQAKDFQGLAETLYNYHEFDDVYKQFGQYFAAL